MSILKNYTRQCPKVIIAGIMLIAGTLYAGNHSEKMRDVTPDNFSSMAVFKAHKQAPVPNKFKAIHFKDTNPAPQPTATEKQRGYILFSQPITQPVYRGTRPTIYNRTAQLSAFATPGEYEPLTFTLFPLRNMGKVYVKVSALRSGSDIIPENSLALRAVTYWNIRFPRYNSPSTYRAMPEFLEKVNPIELHKGAAQRFWLKVKVPDNAKPGIYKGYVTIYEAGAKSALQLPIAFRVLNYKLQRDPKKHYSVYYYGMKSNYAGLSDKAIDKARENELKAMQSYGIDIFPTMVPVTWKDKNGNIHIKLSVKDAFIDKFLKMGFKGPIPLYCTSIFRAFYQKFVPDGKIGRHYKLSKMPDNDKIYQGITRAFKELKQYGKKRGWPEFIVCPMDEPLPETAEVCANVYAAVRRAGLKTFISKDPTASNTEIYKKKDAVDIWNSQPFSLPYSTVVADKRYEYWCYPNHNACENRNPIAMCKGGRMTYGFGFWHSGYTTIMPWHWRWASDRKETFNYLTSTVSGCGVRLDKQQNILSPVYWECFREGFDDNRYIYTLQQAIAERKQSTNPACQKAVKAGEDYLQQLWNSINVQKKYEVFGMWDDKEFNTIRWQLALLTEKLKAFPGKKMVTAPSVMVKNRAPVKKKKFTFANKDVKVFSIGDEAFDRWKNMTVEGKLSVTDKVAYHGKKSLRYDVHIDYKRDGGGEQGKYLVGWPRIATNFTQSNVSLKDYDMMKLWIMVDSDRDEVADNSTPFSYEFIFKSGKKISGKLLNNCEQRVWLPINIDLHKIFHSISKNDQLKRLQFWLAEAYYVDGTKLTFFIDDIKIIKFKYPVIKSVDMQSVIYPYSKQLVVKLNLYGVSSAAKQQYTLVGTIKAPNGKIIATAQMPIVSPKATMVFKPLHSVKPNTGYNLVINIKDHTGKMVSDWQGKLNGEAGPLSQQ